jgi:hypothetical protein
MERFHAQPGAMHLILWKSADRLLDEFRIDLQNFVWGLPFG